MDTDIGWHMNAHWYPLETVLEAWANMIQRAKVRTVEKDAEKNYMYPMRSMGTCSVQQLNGKGDCGGV